MSIYRHNANTPNFLLLITNHVSYYSAFRLLWPTILGRITSHGICTREEECQASEASSMMCSVNQRDCWNN